MSLNVHKSVIEATSALEGMNADQLLEELGRRQQTVQSDVTFGGNPALKAPEGFAMNLDTAALRQMGADFLNNVEHRAFLIVCCNDGKIIDQIKDALLKGSTLEAALATALIGSVGLAPAFAPVVATLIIALLVKPAAEALCSAWSKRLNTTCP